MCRGVHVISGPVTQSCFSSQPIIPESPPAMHRNYPKCRPCRMLSEPEPPLQPNGLLVSQIPSSLSDFELPDLSSTVLVRSTKNHAILPQYVNVGIIRPQTSEDEATFSDAAETTPSQLADTWHAYACLTQSTPMCVPSQAQPTSTSSCSWKVCDQLAEMHQSGLDSSILSPFLPEPDIDHPNIFLPSGDVHLDPYSEEYFQKLVEALDLDTSTYSHVSPKILIQFKALPHKYPTAFYLLRTASHHVKGFHHNIHTGDASNAPPVYHMSYLKSPPELAAIKEELKRCYNCTLLA